MPDLYLCLFDAQAQSTSLWLDYAKTLIILVGVCLLALVVVKVVLPRFAGFTASTASHVQILTRYPLEPRKTLYLVKIGKSVILLATSAETVQFMTTLNSEDFEEMTSPSNVHEASGSAFRRIAQTFADLKQDKSL